MSVATSSHSLSPHELIQHALEHLDHVLPAQAPIMNFVHHNTIHGFQHLPFEQALEAFEQQTGIKGYLPEAQFRHFYQQGRIEDKDLFAAMAEQPELNAEEIILQIADKTLTRKDLYKQALLNDFAALTPTQFAWQVNELKVFASEQANSLWQALSEKLTLPALEDLENLNTPEAIFSLSQQNELLKTQPSFYSVAAELVEMAFAEIGETSTLRSLIQQLTGIDILDSVRPQLIRLCASALDEGVAAWQIPARSELGFYSAWLAMLKHDATSFFAELDQPVFKNLETLPDNAINAIILQLTQMQIPQEKWQGYLERLALEIPGWAGMFNWRQHNPKYQSVNDIKPQLADFLAIRLTLDSGYLNKICRELWKLDARLDKLQHYFAKHPAEFFVRRQFYQAQLPEQLHQLAQDSLQTGALPLEFQQLADLIWIYNMTANSSKDWQSSAAVYNEGWRLFCLCQKLGLNSRDVQQLSATQLQQLLKILDEFTLSQRNQIWLAAYEQHYRNQIFHALQANERRGRWFKREPRPSAQLVFCMDEREESIRRHLEELNPDFETLGAAGFFGIAMNYQGLDDVDYTPLCPVVVTPVHQVHEVPKSGSEQSATAHYQAHKREKKFYYLQYQSLRRNLLRSSVTIPILAPFNLLDLTIKSLFPNFARRLGENLHHALVPSVSTELKLTKTNEQNPIGFSDNEQAERVGNFLRAIGLTSGFAPIVCFLGHGSTSLNNPHEAAHDCGACGGRRGGPNARAFAAMANRTEVRKLLAERGIIIPEDCWFIGTQHDTCSDEITWYDIDSIPLQFQTLFHEFKTKLLTARDSAAHERCRRLLSRNHPHSPAAALKHVKLRSADLSQVRPEFGHATNAVAIIGRRALTQGLFLDRRAFLISYDPIQDADGKILESILLTAGPVGAGINLEYYFSTINNERFGCGTKIPHNIIGLFAVMEGTCSDLRTGLPRQMVEIHEAMRLQIIVEAKTSVLEQIYGRQPALQELIAGGWVHLTAKDPDSKDLFVFERGKGFVLWQGESQNLPVYEKSPDYYRGQTEPLAPVLIKQP